MSTSAGDVLFAALIDDASLFPPGDLPMADAVLAHHAHRSGPRADLVGRFLCPASRLDDLRSTLADDAAVSLGLILDTGLAGLPADLATVHGDARLRLTAAEVPIHPDDDPAAAAHATVHAFADLDLSVFVEIPRVHGWRDALSLVAARSLGVKLRTGGLVADAFPSDIELAEFVRACVHEGTRFKCTAGLHHAVRHRDERTGFEHHGFLNIVLATHSATQDAHLSEITEIVALRDPADLVQLFDDLDELGARATRRHFVGFGSCNIDEPIEDLTSLGLIEKVAAVDVG